MNINEIVNFIKENALNILIELIMGYIFIYLVGFLCLLPGKDKIQNVINKKEYQDKKSEIINARRWICLGWTLIVVAINLYILLK